MVKNSIIASLASLVLVLSGVIAVPAAAASNASPYPGRSAGLPCSSGATGCVYDLDAGKWLLKDACSPDDRGCHYDSDIGLWFEHQRDVGLWLTGGAISGVLLANVLNINSQNCSNSSASGTKTTLAVSSCQQNQPASP